MRIRTIKPEWLDDDRLAESGSDARTLSVALILLADDSGRGRLSRSTPAKVFPCDVALFEPALTALTPWFARVYEVRGQRYFEVANWSKHQKIDKPSKPITPHPSEGRYVDEGVPRDTLSSVSMDAIEPNEAEIEAALCAQDVVLSTFRGADPVPKVTYAIQSVIGGPLKIGRSERPRERLSTLQTGNPHRLRFVAFVSSDETSLHRALSAHRIHGTEWFHPHTDVIAAIGMLSRDTRETLAPDLDQEGTRKGPGAYPRARTCEAHTKSPDALRAEALQREYLARFVKAFPRLKPDACCHAGNGGPWLEVARSLEDDQVAPFLDAFFADKDPFVAKDRAPSKLASQRVRLLGQVSAKAPTIYVENLGEFGDDGPHA